MSREASDARVFVARAVAAFAAGKLDEAEALGRQILETNASDFDALHLLGAIEVRRGHLQVALDFWDKARAIKPHHVELLKNYGVALGASLAIAVSPSASSSSR